MSSNLKFPTITNLCYIIKENKVLLQKKARGFGKGKWNAPGGKKRPGESIEKSVIREVGEETELSVYNLDYVGFHEFIFDNKNDWNNKCHIFMTDSFKGSPRDTGEGELRWFEIENIPLAQMWDDDKYWTLDMLLGKKFNNMRFFFDKNGKYLKHKII